MYLVLIRQLPGNDFNSDYFHYCFHCVLFFSSVVCFSSKECPNHKLILQKLFGAPNSSFSDPACHFGTCWWPLFLLMVQHCRRLASAPGAARLLLLLTFIELFTIPLDLRPVCKFKFVRFGLEEKNRALYLSRFNCGGPMKFENTFFQIAKLRFLTIFNDFRQNSKHSQGTSLKARGLIFWILALYIRI